LRRDGDDIYPKKCAEFQSGRSEKTRTAKEVMEEASRSRDIRIGLQKEDAFNRAR